MPAQRYGDADVSVKPDAATAPATSATRDIVYDVFSVCCSPAG
jgi:hypothetical protein